MATLEITNNFSLESHGRTVTGKQGVATDNFGSALEVDVDGLVHDVIGELATASVVTVYDDDNDVPADWDYAFFWGDEDFYIQVIGAATNFIVKVEAYHPFVLSGFDSMLAAADTTAITGGTEPTMSDIDSIVIGNYSGNTMNYQATFIT